MSRAEVEAAIARARVAVSHHPPSSQERMAVELALKSIDIANSAGRPVDDPVTVERKCLLDLRDTLDRARDEGDLRTARSTAIDFIDAAVGRERE